MPVKKIKPIVAKVLARINASQGEKADNPPWIKQVAMLTGVLAAVSGFLAVRATTLTNNAIYESNQAILSQTEASDAWNEYQADSIKSRIMKTALTTAEAIRPESRAALIGEAADLRARQSKIKQTATGKTAERDRHLQTGLKWLAERDLLVYGLTAQIGIALASVRLWCAGSRRLSPASSPALSASALPPMHSRCTTGLRCYTCINNS